MSEFNVVFQAQAPALPPGYAIRVETTPHHAGIAQDLLHRLIRQSWKQLQTS